MCITSTMIELDELAKQLYIVNRELTLVADPIKARSALDSVIDRIEVAAQQAPQHHVAVVNSVAQAHNLALEAQHVLHDNLSAYLDPEVVASGLLVVARVRLQQASRALEAARWAYAPQEAAKSA